MAPSRRSAPLAVCAVLLAAALLALGTAPVARASEPPRHRYPWQFSHEEVPKLPWEGLHNDLEALLKVQGRDKKVAVMVFNEGFSALALNCLVSLIEYGNSPNYVLMAVGASSLKYCQDLRLPCFDGGNLLDAAPANATGGPEVDAAAPAANKTALSADADAKRNSADWFHLVWIKTLAAHAVNKLGYDILFADADVVFLKDAWKAYDDLLERYEADGSFMYEQGNYTRSDGTHFVHKYLNSGNFLLKYNNRTKNMMEMWRVGFEFQLNVNGNQLWLNRLDKLGYKICHEKEVCMMHREEDWAAVKPHPNQFLGKGAMCTPDSFEEGLCTDRRLYVHAVCKQGHTAKIRAFKKLGLWFVDINKADPTQIRIALPLDGSLPCGGPTWSDVYPFSS